MTEITIAGRRIGNQHEPYIVAEMSANHNGDINVAYKIIEEAKKAGASAVKMQTYTPDTITLNSDAPDFQIKGGLWDGKSLYELYEWAHTPWEWHKPLFDYAAKLDIPIFSSPFDSTAVDLLEDLNAPAYKIASFEAIDLALISYVASTRKPMIISTGMANEEEIADAIGTAKDAGCEQIAVLHCVSGYPAPPDEYNLRTIHDMKHRFGVVTGLSDHTLDNATAIAGVAMGAAIIEKHFTLDRGQGGPDDSFSMEPNDLKLLCQSSAIAWRALGKVNYERVESEKGNLQFRRSLYAVKNIKKGEVLSPENIRSIRPGYGLGPRFLEEILGRTAAEDLPLGTALQWDLVEGFRDKDEV